MFNVINISIMNNFTTVQELRKTSENTQGQQNVFQGSRTQISFDNKFKKSPWRSKTSANLSYLSELRRQSV